MQDNIAKGLRAGVWIAWGVAGLCIGGGILSATYGGDVSGVKGHEVVYEENGKYFAVTRIGPVSKRQPRQISEQAYRACRFWDGIADASIPAAGCAMIVGTVLFVLRLALKGGKARLPWPWSS